MQLLEGGGNETLIVVLEEQCGSVAVVRDLDVAISDIRPVRDACTSTKCSIGFL